MAVDFQPRNCGASVLASAGKFGDRYCRRGDYHLYSRATRHCISASEHLHLLQWVIFVVVVAGLVLHIPSLGVLTSATYAALADQHLYSGFSVASWWRGGALFCAGIWRVETFGSFCSFRFQSWRWHCGVRQSGPAGGGIFTVRGGIWTSRFAGCGKSRGQGYFFFVKGSVLRKASRPH